ncbi:MAG: hypothetical protein NTV93_06065 [Verrucomicrobia bacterium]|nr:hypothetical protein [Verrucomicrobiota bacterium]
MVGEREAEQALALQGRKRPKLACLDYGTGKGRFLCAYRWDGEREIDTGKFTTAMT